MVATFEELGNPSSENSRDITDKEVVERKRLWKLEKKVQRLRQGKICDKRKANHRASQERQRQKQDNMLQLHSNFQRVTLTPTLGSK